MVTILHWLVYFLIILEIRQRKIIWHTNHRNMKIIHLCWSTFQLIFIHFRDLPFPIHFLHCIQRLRFVMMSQNHLLLKETKRKTWLLILYKSANWTGKQLWLGNNQVDLEKNLAFYTVVKNLSKMSHFEFSCKMLHENAKMRLFELFFKDCVVLHFS